MVDDDESYNLNDIFREKIQAEENSVSLQVGDEEFTLLHVKAEEVSINGNKLYLYANNRLVEVKDLDKYITDLDRTIYEKNGFWYIGVLRGHYLDAKVGMNRLSFSIPDNGMPDSMTITMDQILAASIIEVEKFLSPYLQPISESKLKHIQSYVASQAPQYRHLMKYMPKDIAQIKPNLTDEKLDDELHKIKRKFDNQVRTDNAKLLKDLNKGTISSEDYQKRFQEHIERVSTANSAVLAEYVAHRKVIIDLLESAIRKNNDSEFEVESYLHNLIYPMRTTSTDLPYDNHNLWLLDEKLSYCTYISSDIPFDNNPKEDRTDIMILDSPVAVSDEVNRGLEYETIVLFELKCPMRDDYTDVENPIYKAALQICKEIKNRTCFR